MKKEKVIYHVTVPEFAEEVGKTRHFVGLAVRLGKIHAVKKCGRWLMPDSEVEKFKRDPFTISRKEAYSHDCR